MFVAVWSAFACAFSRHDRHRQFRYCLRSSSLVSVLSSISPHQQPRPRSISHVNDCPHASHVCDVSSKGKVEVNDLASTSVHLGVVAALTLSQAMTLFQPRCSVWRIMLRCGRVINSKELVIRHHSVDKVHVEGNPFLSLHGSQCSDHSPEPSYHSFESFTWRIRKVRVEVRIAA